MSESWIKEWTQELFDRLVDAWVIEKYGDAEKEGPGMIEAFFREKHGLAEADSILQNEEEEEDEDH